MRTSELQGTALDWAVSVAHKDVLAPVAYSRQWRFGGPIIELAGIAVRRTYEGSGWTASIWTGQGTVFEEGPTPLVAAMRCYVAAHLGDEVEVPEELK